MDIRFGNAIVSITPEFKPGDQPPKGMMDWFEWAEVQHKARLCQSFCEKCEKWCYPQEVCCGSPRLTAKEVRKRERELAKQAKKPSTREA